MQVNLRYLCNIFDGTRQNFKITTTGDLSFLQTTSGFFPLHSISLEMLQEQKTIKFYSL